MAKVKIKSAKKPTPPKRVIDWAVIKLDYIQENLRRGAEDNDDPYSLKEVAEKWKLSYGQVRNVAGKERWNAELKRRQQQRSDGALRRIQDYEEFNEVEVRMRQAAYARNAAQIALKRLREVDPEEIKVGDAISMLRLGLQEERKAVGLPDVFTFTPPPMNEQGEYESVTEHVARMARLQQLGARLLEYVESSDE